jgi:hypothetical protein
MNQSGGDTSLLLASPSDGRYHPGQLQRGWYRPSRVAYSAVAHADLHISPTKQYRLGCGRYRLQRGQ